MMRKRSLIPDVYKQKKKLRLNQRVDNAQSSSWADSIPGGDVPSDTKAALLFLKSLFPLEKFEQRVPAIIIQHQLYSIVTNRTQADKELGDLRLKGEVRLFKLGSEADEICIVFTDDYKKHVLRVASEGPASARTIVDKFLNSVIEGCQDISLNKDAMMNTYNFRDDEITQLVKVGVLTVRDVGSWWLAIPGAGIFMKTYVYGRKTVLTVIRKCKYHEILQQELEVRKWPKMARLGILYHIHDIIGADLIQSIETTSGKLLRLLDNS